MIPALARSLLGAGGAAVLAIVTLWFAGTKEWTAPAAQSLDPALFDVPVMGPAATGETSSSEVAERPLFARSRRPEPPPAAAAEALEPDPFANVQLSGLFQAGGNVGAILISDGRPKRITVGERIGRWTLSGVEGKTARFGGPGGEARDLVMKYLIQPPADLAAGVSADKPGNDQQAVAAPAPGAAGAAAAPAPVAPAASGRKAARVSESFAERIRKRRELQQQRRDQLQNRTQ